jgi:hypothetical protein
MAAPSGRRHQDTSRSIERSGVFAGVLGDRARHDVPSGFIRTTTIAESVRLLPLSGGVAYDRNTLRHIAGDNRAGPDHCIAADGHARKDDRPAAYPNVLSDRYGTAELGTRLSDRRIARMIGRVYLNSRSDLRSGANGNRDDIKNDAVEVEKNVRLDPDVIAKITMERRPDNGTVSYFRQQFAKERSPFGCRCRKRSVITNHPHFRGGLICLNFRVAGVVQFPRQHFLFLCAHIIDIALCQAGFICSRHRLCFEYAPLPCLAPDGYGKPARHRRASIGPSAPIRPTILVLRNEARIPDSIYAVCELPASRSDRNLIISLICGVDWGTV